MQSGHPPEFPDASFDLIYGTSVFTHIDKESQESWLAELDRLLRHCDPGGLDQHPTCGIC